MQLWVSRRVGVVQRFSCLRWILAVSMIMEGIWIAGPSVTLSESGVMGSPDPRWVFTTKGHFTFYGLLTGAPRYRDEVRSVLLDSDRAYLAVVLGRSGILFSPASDIQFLALNRHRGHPVWDRRVQFNGYPVGGQLVLTRGRLVAALFEEQTREIVILGMDPTDGRILWRVGLPGAKGPVGDEVILVTDQKSDSVTAYFYNTKLRNRVVLRATDGVRVPENSYNSFFWRFGNHQAGGLVFGYDGRMSGEYDRLLVFHEKSGHLAWALPLSRHWVSPPTVVDHSLLITTQNQLSRLDFSNGKPRWTVSLRGRVPPTPDPPLVMGPRVAITHQASPNPEEKHWKLSVYRLADGAQEAELDLGELGFPNRLRPAGDLMLIGSNFVLQVVDPQSVRIVASLDFEKQLSRFVYTDPPAMDIADSDAEGFLVYTTDGRLRYFSVADFRKPEGTTAR